MLDAFNSDMFSFIELTQAINVIPNDFTTLRRKGLFQRRGVRDLTVAVEKQGHKLNLLAHTPRGGAANVNEVGKRDIRSFRIPQIALEDTIWAHDVQSVRAFGQEEQRVMVQDMVSESLATMARKYGATWEAQYWGALQGQVLDADGSVYIDYATEFGVARPAFDWGLGTPATNIRDKCRELKRHLELSLFGETMTSIEVWCSPEFWDKFIERADVQDAYTFHLAAGGKTPAKDDLRGGFHFFGIDFYEELGHFTQDDGTTIRRNVPVDEAIVILNGTQQLYDMVDGPADFMETVNRPGRPMNAKSKLLDYDRGVTIYTQSNPLPIVNRIELIPRVHTTT